MKERTSDFYCCYNKLLFFLTIRLWLVSHCLIIYGQRQRLQLELGYRFSFFFLSSFKWMLAYQFYALLKELQIFDNKHLYWNTVEILYRHIFRSSIWTATYSKQDWTGFQSRRLRNKFDVCLMTALQDGFALNFKGREATKLTGLRGCSQLQAA